MKVFELERNRRYDELSVEELKELRCGLEEEYRKLQDMKLSLNMSRGRPGLENLALSTPMMDILTRYDYISENDIDCRNYGELDGIPEMKRIMADIMDVSPDEVIASGNSSLALMFDNVAVNMSHGVREGQPWRDQGKVKFICPVPGYDRHYSICDYFHIDMIPVELRDDGPYMDVVEALVHNDPMIKGMWCMPIYSNPTGHVYSDETVRRLARLEPAADDFRLYWDNAYCIHQFDEERRVIPNIIRECEKAGNPNMPLEFISFSKVSFAGAAVSAITSSKSNCEYIRKRLFVQTLGPDKLNQLRHVRFFKDAEGVYRHMEKMADFIRPKFKTVLNALENNLAGKAIGNWNSPKGGYFISFNTIDGCAKRTVRLCREAGLVLTDAGATYPYGKDPHDCNIRIAPTYPSIEELEMAMEIFCVALRLASVETLLNE